jgi:Fe-S-cluster containining protein
MPDETATATIVLSVGGERFDARMTVPAGPTSPSRLLPTFRALANAVVDLGVEKARLEGETVSCARGCGACCRQLVPISPAEAAAIRELVEGLPAERRATIEGRFARARERLSRAGFLERLLGTLPLDAGAYDRFGLDYFHLGIPCPFLEDESCSIYEDRPIICREYLVTSDPVHCANPAKETVRCVEIPAKVSKAVGRLDMAVGPPRRPWVALVLAPEWARAHPEPPPTRTGPQLVEQFVRHLAGEAAPNEVPHPRDSGKTSKRM